MTTLMMRWLERFNRFDQRSFHWLNERFEACCRHQLIRWISRSGDGYCYAIIALLVGLLQGVKSTPIITALVIGFMIEIPLFMVLKRSLKRQRPYHKHPDFKAVILAHDQFSFPSGHTTAAFLFAGIMSTFFPGWFWVLYGWAGAIGLSRVLLGVHYPGDVVAGALLGYGISAYVMMVMDAVG
ncbi:undecaprenyl-diphosphatase [Pseudidiomarina indica]|uniref:undecaprenyl-diphosphate phosphatase n=1 Tax=Pseudidiomarina indica TaxID=1159017 RepID=A0A1G6C9P9_9GAMM|nr:phosphatase PAP2 family protein [Pseudidiomarina indica]SDB29605.1 undecaprenyl-diphosphatase [Pseudidiomarina indica]